MSNPPQIVNTGKICLFILLLASVQSSFAQRIITVGVPDDRTSPPYKIVGNVFDSGTGEPIPAANIFIERQNIGTSADLDGNYALDLYQGLYLISKPALPDMKLMPNE